MKDKLKSLLTLTNWKRLIISAITLIATVLAIVFGSVFFVSKNPNKSIEYGGGIEVLVQVKKDNKSADVELTNKVSDSLYDRLNAGGLSNVNVSSEGDGKIRVTKSGNLTDTQRKDFEEKIARKPILTVTDIDVKPLFYNGQFQENGSLEVGTPSSWIPPFQENGAKYGGNVNGQNTVSLTLKDSDAQAAWTKATEYISSKASTNQNYILIWSDIEGALELAKTKYPDDWEKSKHNLYNFMHVNNEAMTYTTDSNGQIKVLQNTLKESEFNAKKYLISVARVSEPLNTKTVSISGSFTPSEATQLANDINYGLSDYDLVVLSSVYVNQSLNDSAFQSAMLAGLVVFVLIAIFMIVNYGLLGALSTISIALYIFLTLLMFTVLRGEYSPSTIAALIIGIGISVDANIITFERLKNEIYAGDTIKKAYRNANRFSLSSIIDANITTIIVAFALFYFGTKSVKGFSISLMLSIIFTLLVMLVFTRFMSSLIVGSGILQNRLWLLAGVHKKNIKRDNSQKFYIRFNYIKHAKWFALSSLILIIVGVIVFVSIGLQSSSIFDGLNRSIEFKGGVSVIMSGNTETQSLISQIRAEQIKEFLVANAQKWNVSDIENLITIQKTDNATNNYAVLFKTTQDLSDTIAQIQSDIRNQFSDVSVISYTVSSREANELVLNALLAVSVSFIGIILYTLLRMRWTYSIAAIIGLLHDLILVVAFIVLTRLEVSSIIVAAMLSIVGFSINDTIVTFDRIKEIITHQYSSQKVLSRDDIKTIANKAIYSTIKRSFYTTLTTMISVVILLLFKNATDFSFNITILFGMAVGAYSSIFICSWIWTILENIRQKGIKHRINTGYWNVNNPVEQTFKGINDFQP